MESLARYMSMGLYLTPHIPSAQTLLNTALIAQQVRFFHSLPIMPVIRISYLSACCHLLSIMSVRIISTICLLRPKPYTSFQIALHDQTILHRSRYRISTVTLYLLPAGQSFPR